METREEISNVRKVLFDEAPSRKKVKVVPGKKNPRAMKTTHVKNPKATTTQVVVPTGNVQAMKAAPKGSVKASASTRLSPLAKKLATMSGKKNVVKVDFTKAAVMKRVKQ